MIYDNREYQPSPSDPSQVWQGYVMAARSREGRRERLDQCPWEIRPKVKRHVETAFTIVKGAKR